MKNIERKTQYLKKTNVTENRNNLSFYALTINQKCQRHLHNCKRHKVQEMNFIRT